MLTYYYYFFFQSGTSYFRLRKTARKGRTNITPQETASPLCVPQARTCVVKVCKSQTTDALWRGEVHGHAAYKEGKFKRSINHEQVSLRTRS